jgi:hypothetical protein
MVTVFPPVQLEGQALEINAAQVFVGGQQHPATKQRGFGQT